VNLLSQLFSKPSRYGRTVWLSLFHSRSLRGALLLILLGAVLWVKRDLSTTATDPNSPPAPPAADSTASIPRSPLPFRLGAGFAGGFLISFAFRKFLKATALLAGLLLAAVTTGRALGWVDLDWNTLENSIRSALSWTHEQALSVKAVLESYLPATAASGLGLWQGWRHGAKVFGTELSPENTAP